MAVQALTTTPAVAPPAEQVTHIQKKRKLSINDSPSPSLHEVLTPVTGSRASTPHPGAAEQDLEVFLDGHSDYEWVRLPKNREYDLFKVARQTPSERDSAELPLVVRRDADGKDVTMWAKMDTGADCNVINRSTVSALFGAGTKLDKHLRTLTIADQGDFSLVGNNNFRATHYTTISFKAGVSNKHFDSVRFIVIPDDWSDPNGDGVPNVILGLPFLRAHSMVMIDLDYHQDADPELEVVAGRAQEEKEGSRAIMINVYAPTKGVVRPSGPRRPR